MNFIQRITGILFSPRRTWQTISAEQTDAKALYTRYLIFVALIPACSNLASAFITAHPTGQSIPVLWPSVFISAMVGYALLLLIIRVLAWLANRLSPRFGGINDPFKALQLVAYSATAGMVGGIFSIIPSLFILGVLASLYAFYLLFLGAPTMLKTPQEKAFSFAFMMLICSLPIGAVFAGLFGIIFMLFR